MAVSLLQIPLLDPLLVMSLYLSLCVFGTVLFIVCEGVCCAGVKDVPVCGYEL